MEVISNPLYDKCKKIVKVWEYEFKTQFGRPPSKLDIREADKNVRDAYSIYFKLKTAALEESLLGILDDDITSTSELRIVLTGEDTASPDTSTSQLEPENDSIIDDKVWGEHLNKSNNSITQNLTPKRDDTLNASFAKKLFANSKFSKRNPRKSLINQPDINQSLTQPALSNNSSPVFSFNSSLRVTSNSHTIHSQSITLYTNNINKPARKIDKGWLKRVTEITDLSKNEQIIESENDDIVSDSDTEDNSLFHPAKRLKLSPTYDTITFAKSNLPKLVFNVTSLDSSLAPNLELKSGSNHDLKPLNQTSVKTKSVDSELKTPLHNQNRNTQSSIEQTDHSEYSAKSESIHNSEHESDYKSLHNLNRNRNETLNAQSSIVQTDPSDNSQKTKFIQNSEDQSDDILKNPVRSVNRNQIRLNQTPNAQSSHKQFDPSENPLKTKLVQHSEDESDDALKDPLRNLNRNRNQTRNAQSSFEQTDPSDNSSTIKSVQDSEDESVDKLKNPLRILNRNRKPPNQTPNAIAQTDPFEDSEVESDDALKKPLRSINRNRINSDSDDSPKKIISKRKRKTANVKSAKPRKIDRKPASKPNDQIEPESKTDDDEQEYSLNPPPATVPRFTQLIPNLAISETVETVKTGAALKRGIAKTKLEKKIASGTLNENFVRIDMKKKIYVRGKKSINFTKYKKQMWKNKRKSLHGPEMDMGGCDGGPLTCFKCGKTGHMARQCKAVLHSELLPLAAFNEDECTLASLEEASNMAKNNVCAIRTPNLIPECNAAEVDIDTDAEACIDTGAEAGIDTDAETGIDADAELEEWILNNDDFENTQTLSQSVINKNTISPLYALKPNGATITTPSEVLTALHQFGHDSFRPGQEQAIMRILSGKSTLVTLSTGSGKSLCYQLPAYLYAKHNKCITLIISPLVSLMEDQVAGISAFLNAGCLHTSQTPGQREKVMKLIESGDLDILLISPEAVTAGEKKTGFRSLFRKLPPIAFACIDEAHCVSQWSHNFRPSYLVLCRVLRERLGIQTVLGLTATSTHATSASIVEHLQIPDGCQGVISDIPLPDNLFLSVSSDQQRDGALRALLGSEPFDKFDSVIIYCTRREECERIAAYLRTNIRDPPNSLALKKYKSLSSTAEPYHAGLPASKRRTVQNAFMGGYLRIVVATVAFGMGINISTIRAVIHYNMPRNFESYVQEVGRAGRDGLPAHCHLFLDSEGRDQNELKRHIYANSMDRHSIRKLLEKIFVPCGCKGVCPRHEVAFSVAETVQYLDVPEENISTLMCYLELHEKRYLEVLTPVYIDCKIISYGGPAHIKRASKDCAPLAMALALHKKDLTKNVFEFPVVDVAAAMGWDSGMVKNKLKNLEWITENNMPKRSTLTIEFSNLGFHLRAPGNLPPSELDDALDSLSLKKKEQEQTSLLQLQAVHSTLTSVSEKHYDSCLTENYTEKSSALKTRIRTYFSCEQPLKDIDLSNTQTALNESQVISDIRNLTAMYKDTNFTGRAVARIFQGIQSPNYPAVIWGRCKYWRAHINSDFNQICQIAIAEILRLR